MSDIKWRIEETPIELGKRRSDADEQWAGTPEQEIETLREMVEQRDAEIERLRGRVDSLQEAQK